MTYYGLALWRYPKFWDPDNSSMFNSSVGSNAATTKTPDGVRLGPIRIPVASNYDLDNDYDYIMAKALKSYKIHREKEKAESRRQFKTSYMRRYHGTRPQTAPPMRVIVSKANSETKEQRSHSVFMPKFDEITEVKKANEDDEDDRSPRKVLQVATVNIAMLNNGDSPRAKCFKKRNEGSHPWYSHSYPNVSSNQFKKFMEAHAPQHVQQRHAQENLKSVKDNKHLTERIHPTRPRSAMSQSMSASSSPSSTKEKYNYDGGVFTHCRRDQRGFFVIHPDWVSESLTIQKMSLGDRQKRSMSWPGRRCKSAPPSKWRNPITWDSDAT